MLSVHKRVARCALVRHRRVVAATHVAILSFRTFLCMKHGAFCIVGGFSTNYLIKT